MTGTLDERATASPVEHVDVLIVGAGISGVGAAYHLQEQCPERSFVVLEAMDDFGGTWRCHTYPGIRSDSDLYTFGYRFKPWTSAPIASRDEILKYMSEVIEENGLARQDPLPPQDHVGDMVERGRPLDARWPPTPAPARCTGSPRTSCGCARATTATPRATPPSGRAWTGSVVRSSTPRRGPRTSTTAARRSSSSDPARRRRRWCRRWPPRPSTSP